jgi:crotonobetainyl-CoA:carnitine CoA-transferase CaiB-like acyl-CoA transferase
MVDFAPKDLSGLLVVSIEQAVAAPYLSSRLADAGARVIKVERQEGDFARNYDNLVNGNSAYFVWLNRGKESIALDLKSTDDISVLKNIIKKADILIQNLAPGAFDRLGLNLSDLRQQYPSLITCSITGFGESGPYMKQKAYDMLIQAEAGLTDLTGVPANENESGRARVGVSVCDISAGMTALQAVQLALIGRMKTGKGRHISVSLYSALADWMNVPFLQYKYGNKVPERCGIRHPTIAPYASFMCSDGREILIGIQNEREWANLCDIVLNIPNLKNDNKFSDNSKRVINRESLENHINQCFIKLTRDEVIKKCDDGGIAYGRISDMEQLSNHPQNLYMNVQTPNGTIKLLASGAQHDGKLPEGGSVPKINENGEEIRKEFK